eukprot:12930002-Prorocentrum_lima.AAC.1
MYTNPDPGERVGLLVDIGAHDNLMCDGLVKRMGARALRVGKPVHIDKQHGIGSVCGVGGATSSITHEATAPI